MKFSEKLYQSFPELIEQDMVPLLLMLGGCSTVFGCVAERIVNLEKKLFETQSRNDGLRNSLEQVENKVNTKLRLHKYLHNCAKLKLNIR